MSNMVARMAASGSGPGKHGQPEDGNGLPGGRILAAAAAAVALIYGGTLAYLLLADSRFAGEPVIRLALAAPEEPEPAAPGAEEAPDMADAPDAPADPMTAGNDAGGLSEEEQALLDAARSLDVPLGTFMSRLGRGREALRKLVGEIKRGRINLIA